MMKQVILMRTDLGMTPGKMCAQAAHASIRSSVPTIVVSVSTLTELEDLCWKAQQEGLEYSCVTDAGRTEVPEGTTTCGSIVGDDAEVDKITGHLELL